MRFAKIKRENLQLVRKLVKLEYLQSIQPKTLTFSSVQTLLCLYPGSLKILGQSHIFASYRDKKNLYSLQSQQHYTIFSVHVWSLQSQPHYITQTRGKNTNRKFCILFTSHINKKIIKSNSCICILHNHKHLNSLQSQQHWAFSPIWV